MPEIYGPPQKVSPLIRSLRWGFLIAGIFFGRMKQARYSSLQEQWRKDEAVRKVARDIEMKKLKAKVAAEERENVRLLETGKLFDTDDGGSSPPSSSGSSAAPPPQKCK